MASEARKNIRAETTYQELVPDTEFNNHYKDIAVDISWMMSLIMPRFNEFRAAIGWDAHRSKYITGDYIFSNEIRLKDWNILPIMIIRFGEIVTTPPREHSVITQID